MRLLVLLLSFPVVMFGATESVSIDTKTKKVQNPIVNFGAGNTLNGTGATIIGFPGSSYTFIDSLTQSAGNVSLVNDSASPGNSKYYGTDSGGVLGFHTITGGGGTFIGLDFTNSISVGYLVSDDNTALGFGALQNNLATGNSAFGATALAQVDTGTNNTAVGVYAGQALVDGSGNTLIGWQATTTSGSTNGATGIGGNSIILGNNSVVVGYSSDAAGTNQIVLGSLATLSNLTDPNNIAVIGNPSITDVYFGANTPIGPTSGIAILHAPNVLPAGGVTGARLVKASNTNYDAVWATPTATPTTTPAAPADAHYVTTQFESGLSSEWSLGGMFTGILAIDVAASVATPVIVTVGTGLVYTTATHTLSAATPTPTPTATPSATATPTPTPSATATAYPQGFTAHFSRGGAAIQANDVTITPWTTKYPGTITGFIISSDQGTCTLKVWKKATGTAIPTIADVINTSGVSLATGTHIDSTTVTDFTTTTVSVGDQFMAQVIAVSGGATDITFQIPIRQ